MDRNWLIFLAGLQFFGQSSWPILIVSAIAAWIIRSPNLAGYPLWKLIISWSIVASVLALYILASVLILADVLRPEVHGYPENWGAYLGIFVVPWVCLALFFNAGRTYRTMMQNSRTGFDVVLTKVPPHKTQDGGRVDA